MTHAATTKIRRPLATTRLDRIREALRARRERRAVHRRVVAELSGMTDRDLLDIGVSRGQIPDLARRAAEDR